MLLAELRDLRRDDHLAVGLRGVTPEIVAVVVLSRVERGERRDLRDNRSVPHAGRGQVADDLLGDGLLLLAVVEDGGAVLRADVRALAIQRRRVVHAEKDVQQVAERDNRGVERDVDDLGVARRAAADLTVRRVDDVAARVAGLDALDTL